MKLANTNLIAVKNPTQQMLSRFFRSSLLDAEPYKIHAPTGIQVKLDQNENPWDLPEDAKQQILARVQTSQWNRYPSSMGEELSAAIAKQIGVTKENVLTSPGSNYLIALIFSALGHQLTGNFVVARPSFSLFEMTCCFEGIDFHPWELDDNFRYQPRLLDNLPPGSVVVFASPNNPTGTALEQSELRALLTTHHESLFIADEAYFEFAKEPALGLLKEFDNLIILRTFSKSMGSAGLRLGYLVGSSGIMEQFRKLRLPYLLNHFALAAGLAVYEDVNIQKMIAENLQNTVQARSLLQEELVQISQKGQGFQVFSSQANFLLMRASSNDHCDRIYQGLLKKGVLVRNVSSGRRLARCLRVTVGNNNENTQFLEAMKTLV